MCIRALTESVTPMLEMSMVVLRFRGHNYAKVMKKFPFRLFCVHKQSCQAWRCLGVVAVWTSQTLDIYTSLRLSFQVPRGQFRMAMSLGSLSYDRPWAKLANSNRDCLETKQTKAPQVIEMAHLTLFLLFSQVHTYPGPRLEESYAALWKKKPCLPAWLISSKLRMVEAAIYLITN